MGCRFQSMRMRRASSAVGRGRSSCISPQDGLQQTGGRARHRHRSLFKFLGTGLAGLQDAETLETILDPATFLGIVISDDAAVYANFTQSQKCWAHLLRKAIKLTLQEPGNAEYRQFTDRLLEIYRSACRVQKDGRRSMAGRAQKVAELDDEILELCAPLWVLELPPLEEGPENDYRLLVNEVMRLMLDKQLDLRVLVWVEFAI